MNRNGDTMVNGFGLSPQLAAWVDYAYSADQGFPNIQGNIILPKPLSNHLYYLFQIEYDTTLWQYGLPRPNELLLNTIDMNGDSGLGEVIEKNKLIFKDTMSDAGMTTCRHANGRDWWLVRNEYLTNCYYTWLITPDSIIGPSKQCIGEKIIEPTTNSNFKFSPDGNYFANQYAKDLFHGALNLFYFDRCTGQFSNPALLDIPDSATYDAFFFCGVQFSANSRFLYAINSTNIVQFDLDSTDIQNSAITVSKWNYSDTTFAYFGLKSEFATDGKIYNGGVFCNPALSVINDPDQKGLACNVTLQSFILPTQAACGVPDMPNYELGALPGSPCDTLATVATVIADKEVKDLHIIPNPNDGRFAVSYHLPQNQQGILTITNTLGKEVYRAIRPQWSSIQPVNLRGLSEGIYFVTLESNGTSMSAKFVKQ
ncbi:MAG: T9SS type A sorting domain-containing protein [Chitinophagales bacterium]